MTTKEPNLTGDSVWVPCDSPTLPAKTVEVVNRIFDMIVEYHESRYDPPEYLVVGRNDYGHLMMYLSKIAGKIACCDVVMAGGWVKLKIVLDPDRKEPGVFGLPSKDKFMRHEG